jgi:hypothetical protein
MDITEWTQQTMKMINFNKTDLLSDYWMKFNKTEILSEWIATSEKYVPSRSTINCIQILMSFCLFSTLFQFFNYNLAKWKKINTPVDQKHLHIGISR